MAPQLGVEGFDTCRYHAGKGFEFMSAEVLFCPKTLLQRSLTSDSSNVPSDPSSAIVPESRNEVGRNTHLDGSLIYWSMAEDKFNVRLWLHG